MNLDTNVQHPFIPSEWWQRTTAPLGAEDVLNVHETLHTVERAHICYGSAFVSREDWIKTIKHLKAEGASDFTVVNFDLNIYSCRRHATNAGKLLSQFKLFLQQPRFGVNGLIYYNPHYLHPEEVLGKEVLDKPLNFAQKQAHDTDFHAKKQAKTVAQDEIHQTNDTVQINTMLNSLSHNSILAKSFADSSIIKTTPPECVSLPNSVIIAGMYDIVTKMKHSILSFDMRSKIFPRR
ncbi:hypothetical protein QBC36DRAFT_358278 [Triangularia setosa]|uniref:Uncharacterized protein n=1 Tax=Triangularia setosa TaxID=2587417 RepID=A0AAN6W2D6_9PEZI|nr:hypothetical protein QBC36DRAFT_358278 [Podospora setosa]